PADPTADRKPKACQVTGSNLRHARPGAGRALVGNGETGRVQSQPTRHGQRNRQEDRRVRLQNRVVSTTARRDSRAISRNSEFKFFRDSQNMVFGITKTVGGTDTAGD